MPTARGDADLAAAAAPAYRGDDAAAPRRAGPRHRHRHRTPPLRRTGPCQRRTHRRRPRRVSSFCGTATLTALLLYALAALLVQYQHYRCLPSPALRHPTRFLYYRRPRRSPRGAQAEAERTYAAAAQVELERSNPNRSPNPNSNPNSYPHPNPLSASEGERLDALDAIVSDLILLNPTPKPGSTLGCVERRSN